MLNKLKPPKQVKHQPKASQTISLLGRSLVGWSMLCFVLAMVLPWHWSLFGDLHACFFGGMISFLGPVFACLSLFEVLVTGDISRLILIGHAFPQGLSLFAAVPFFIVWRYIKYAYRVRFGGNISMAEAIQFPLTSIVVLIVSDVLLMAFNPIYKTLLLSPIFLFAVLALGLLGWAMAVSTTDALLKKQHD